MTTSTFILFLLLFSYSSPSVHPISWASKESSFHFVLFDDGHGSGDGANENRTENLIPFNGGRHRSVEGTKSPQNGRMNERNSERIGRTSGWVNEWQRFTGGGSWRASKGNGAMIQNNYRSHSRHEISSNSAPSLNKLLAASQLNGVTNHLLTGKVLSWIIY